ncbi:DUF2935 domain-containing protein [Paenibacillus nanensis]|uniref:DUF2935 domain-containing protein n=1 Tax=Paenibacillus nanensis TaxID=393251 RepID=A0A3A1VLW9_9BACL|nr:DUF2935 domain-containing protein [Paenibacillus nanensis]RIX59503.1 DUF2935 domain-containing protein [Paenibacillus nanensis]
MTAGASIFTPYQEHAFWLEILDDHAHFIRDYLSPTETKWVQTAQWYIDSFHALRGKVNQLKIDLPASSPEMIQIAQEIYPIASGYYQFEGHMQRLRIENAVNLNLTPTYLNGTLNENQEYLRLLGYYMQGSEPVPQSLYDLLDLWLEDQLGHAVLLGNVLDPVELGFTTGASDFARGFQALMLKNDTFKGYLRFTPPGFQAQLQLARDTAALTADFYRFVERIIAMYTNTSVLSRATLRFLEHHLPETCYFIHKLEAFDPSIEKLPNCPLTKPSFPLEA